MLQDNSNRRLCGIAMLQDNSTGSKSFQARGRIRLEVRDDVGAQGERYCTGVDLGRERKGLGLGKERGKEEKRIFQFKHI